MFQGDELRASPPSDSEDTGARSQDFVFRFSLAEPQADDVGYEDPLLELIRGQLADLLDVVVLTFHGKRAMVDGFRLLHDPDTQYEILPDVGSSTDV
jgi:hypothetical protein